jgi:hypothetical protein
VRFRLAEKYRCRIVVGQLILVLYYFRPKSALTSSSLRTAFVLISDGN